MADQAEHLAAAGRGQAVTGAKPSNSRSSPVASPSAPITTSLPGGASCAAAGCRPRCSAAGIRPHRVVVARKQRQRAVRQDAVQQLARDRLVSPNIEIGGLLDDQYAGVWLGCGASAHRRGNRVETG